MKKKLHKILFILIILLGSQQVQAQSYQRWIIWNNEPSHEVTASEMADIVSALYNDQIIKNQQYRLSTGVVYTIPNPKTFLKYTERCVKSARPSANTPQEVVDAIYGAERMLWGNDYSLKTKNYWYSTKNNTVTYHDNYSGIGMNTNFLWIDGVPVIKCDCGNGQEVIEGQTVVRTTTTQKNSNNSNLLPSSPTEEVTSFIAPKTALDMALSRVPEEANPKLFIPTEELSWMDKNKKWFIPVASGVAAGLVGFVAHDKQHSWYFWFPKNQNTDSGSRVTVPGHESDGDG